MLSTTNGETGMCVVPRLLVECLVSTCIINREEIPPIYMNKAEADKEERERKECEAAAVTRKALRKQIRSRDCTEILQASYRRQFHLENFEC